MRDQSFFAFVYNYYRYRTRYLGNITHSLPPVLVNLCCALVNNTCNELIIFPGIVFYSYTNLTFVRLSVCDVIEGHR